MKVITTVGTSLIENYNKENNTNIAEDLKDEGYFDNKSYLEDYNLEEKCQKLVKFIKEKGEKACAELSCNSRINKQPHLIVSDTLEGYLVAKTLKSYDSNIIFDEDRDIIKGLNVYDENLFKKEGLSNLIKRLYEIYFNGCVFNISGGYKAVTPYISAFSFINSSTLFYTFENSDKLFSIPSIPIEVKFGIFLKYKSIFKKLNEGIEDINIEEFKNKFNLYEDDFPWNLIDEIEDLGIELNPIGKILYERVNSYWYLKIANFLEFSKENEGNRKQIENAIKELIRKLTDRFEINDNLILNLNKLSSRDDLTHGGTICKDKFIFKSTNEEQIRILYKPIVKAGELILEIYDIKRGASNFNHSKYIEEFKNNCNRFKNIEFSNYFIKKEF